MQSLISQVIDEEGNPLWSRVRFDLARLEFIDPTGVVVLCSLIDYLKRMNVGANVRITKPYSKCVEYLDDFGFFKHYGGQPLRPEAALRKTTVPIERVESHQLFSYLDNRLMPWIADRVGLAQESIATVKTCFEEIFHNIDDHSEVEIGCVFAQFFPKKEHIHVAISDYGVGIPHVVRKRLPNLSDDEALMKACEEGFTTKSNVRNRGAGLPTLIRYVTQRNQGSVLLASGKGELAATLHNGETRIRARAARDGMYPGTLVKVILRTDTFEAMAEDIKPEDFRW
jgi:anti-sigma regulatory factor (Ser/Thr protein kinase)/ABC-type transporter Mla MlaB component